MQNNPKVTIITVLIVLAVGVGGAYVLKNHTYMFDVPKAPEDLPMSPDLPQKFEEFLNGFLGGIDKAIVDYKAERKILVEAVNPTNLREPAYIEENWTMVQQLTPSLNARIDGIVKLFEKAETDVDTLLLNQPEVARQNILMKWDALKKTQGDTYIEYFTYEMQIVSTYHDLMEFYYTNRADMKFNIDTSDFNFTDPKKMSQEVAFKQQIKDLTAQQNEALKKSLPPKQPENPAQ